MDLLDAIAKDQNFKYEVEVVGFCSTPHHWKQDKQMQ